jgi:hypothetical protein
MYELLVARLPAAAATIYTKTGVGLARRLTED